LPQRAFPADEAGLPEANASDAGGGTPPVRTAINLIKKRGNKK